MNPKISVIVPVYNVEKYLNRCIDSILAQTFKDFELILVDDGSFDSSGAICDEYAKLDDRIKVVHKKNGGVSSARNTGIDIAQGEYITFIDSDDYVDEIFFAYAYEKAQEYQVDLFVSGVFMHCKNKTLLEYPIQYEKIYNVKKLLEDWDIEYPSICMCGPCCKLYKIKIIKENEIFFDLSLNCGEDTYFNLNFLEKVQTIFFSDHIFYHYIRENTESLFSRFHKDLYEIHYKVSGKQRDLMKKNDCSKKSLNSFEDRYFRLLLGTIHEYYRFYDKTTKQEKLDLLKKIAKDDNVKKYKLRQITSLKNKILLILLKNKLYNVIISIFDKHYKIVKEKKQK